ncbi:glucose/arabinose dehydrogenase [Hydrogenophaga palleronii]|uniref:Glucose/arabinose dehydrogenase n=2 Tax=Hydrogenophaga palleronii TaxID=65655 RepID=A0ABU1WNA2_9BURK|nr:glucose/arabinose dehydrogenase [Hydrogenophaga palleronii]
MTHCIATPSTRTCYPQAPWRGVLLLMGASLLAAPALAQAPSASSSVTTEVVAKGLQNAWAVAFIGDGRMLVTERPGRMRVVQANGQLSEPLAGVPEVDAVGQGGLLDLIIDRDFTNNRRVHFCYSEPGLGGNSTALASARLSADASRLEEVRVIFSQKPKVSSRLHFGCRIVQAADNSLFLTLGDRYQRMKDAQTLDNHHGKVVRVQLDGTPHPSNPFVGRSGALPEIWSIGHRNLQGATLGPDASLWTHEHGPQGGDEVNRAEAGKNYGWPVITYGESYGGGAIGDGITEKAGLEQPLYHWTPSIAPSGMAFVTTDMYGPGWQGSLLVGSLKFRYLARLQIDGARVMKEDKLLTDLGQRVRDVREGPDGFIYLLTDARDGELLRLRPPTGAKS